MKSLPVILHIISGTAIENVYQMMIGILIAVIIVTRWFQEAPDDVTALHVYKELGRQTSKRPHLLGKKVNVCFIQSVVPLNALYTSPPWQTCSFRHVLDFSGKHSSHVAITHKDYSLIFPHRL